MINKINTKSVSGVMVVMSAIGMFSTNVLATPMYQPKLKAIANEVSANRIRKDVSKLVSFGTRHTLSETKSNTRGIGAARRWIRAEFETISLACGGCLEVIEVSDVISGEKRIPNPTNVVSILAIQKGRIDPSRYVMMSGDIDSRVSDPLNGSSDSPGANDNASGVAGVIEAARVLSKRKFAGSIIYAALSGEEQGLFGGKIVAEYAIKNNWRIKAVLNNDMIGNITGINGVTNNTTARIFSEGTRAVETPEEARIRRFTGGEVDSPSRNLARYIDLLADQYIDNLDTMLIYRLDRFARGGHHRPFNQVGFPGVRIMETNEHYDRQHQDLRKESGRKYGDTLDGVNFDYAAKLTSLNAVALASMSWAPSPPSNVQIKGAVNPDTTLSWNKVNKQELKLLGNYKVYWRYTDQPIWQYSRPTGITQSFTLDNIVIDNYYFGVVSISKDGFESPVVFPGAAGSYGD